MKPQFVHLHAHTHYSLLDGLGKIPAQVKRAKELGMESLAITDHGVLYGAVEFYQECKKRGIKPILGIEAYVTPGDRREKTPGSKTHHLILLAENKTGWHNIIKLSSRAHLEGYYYKPRMDHALLREHSEGIIALSACIGGEVNTALLNGDFEKAEERARAYQDIFGTENFFLEIQDHTDLEDGVIVRERTLELSKKMGIPLVATADMHYINHEDAPYHEVLLAVQTGKNMNDKSRLSLSSCDLSMASPEEMIERFKDAPEAVTNTVKIAERCNVELELGKILIPHFDTPDEMPAMDYLRQLIEERTPSRYSDHKKNKKLQERITYELDVVEHMGFPDYFLIVADIVIWAKSQGISVGPGRGSAAGSVVSYILGITNIDPLEWDLLFERFLNPGRNEMPDIDLDFADTRRDEVLAYAREKYGTDHVAQIITFGTMAARAAIRDAGRAMEVPLATCDMIAKLIPGGPKGMDIKKARRKIPELQDEEKSNPEVKKLLDTAEHLEGVVRHASVHACGLVISDRSLTDIVPIQFAPQNKEIVITQLDMHGVEKLGLLKMDILGLRNLSTIEETLRLVEERHGEKIDIDMIPMDDDATFALLQKGDTLGIFQFESSGMQRYLKELKPTEFEDLAAMGALYRPGPLEMGMVPMYINRKHGKEEVTYLHPKLEPILKETYGIGVYQEQMMRIATDLAGYSLPEADTLRKAIGKKIKKLLDEQEVKMIEGLIKNGIKKKTAEAIWELFPPFARYGFNKSHAISYALISYQTAYLKAHYPVAFTTALFNADRHNIERIAALNHEVQQVGIDVLPPDINKSEVTFVPEENAVRFGLSAIKGVGEGVCEGITSERKKNGDFTDISDLLTRVQHKDLNKKSLEGLIKAGALDTLGVGRGTLLSHIEELVRIAGGYRKHQEQHSKSLFGNMASSTPKIELNLQEMPDIPQKERLMWEKELIGLYLSAHPLTDHQDEIQRMGAITISEALTKPAESSVRVVGMVSKINNIMTRSGQPMAFVMIEDMSPEPVEIVVFTSTLNDTRNVWQENQAIAVAARVSHRNDEIKLICEKAKVLDQ